MYTSCFEKILTLQTFEETTYRSQNRSHNLVEKSGWYAVIETSN